MTEANQIATVTPAKDGCGSQRRRWLPQLSCRVGKAHPDCQRVRRLSSGTNGSGFPVNDRAGLKVRFLVGVAATPGFHNVGGQAVDLLAKGRCPGGVRWHPASLVAATAAVSPAAVTAMPTVSGAVAAAMPPVAGDCVAAARPVPPWPAMLIKADVRAGCLPLLHQLAIDPDNNHQDNEADQDQDHAVSPPVRHADLPKGWAVKHYRIIASALSNAPGHAGPLPGQPVAGFAPSVWHSAALRRA
jgi:hypothetical protein